MPDEQPRYFTLIDLMWQLMYVSCVSTGCYVGWKVGETFLSLFAGGLVGWGVLFGIVIAIRSRLDFDGREEDFTEPR
jgi:hypothetical protein